MTCRKHLFRSVTGIATLVFAVMFSAAQTTAPNSANSADNSREKLLALRLIAAKEQGERDRLLKNDADLVNSKLATEIRNEADRLEQTVPRSVRVEIYKLGLRVSEQIGDKTQIIRSLESIGKALDGKEQKLAAFEQALSVCEKTANCTLLPAILNRIAAVYLDVDEMEPALEYSKRALAAAEKSGNKREIANAYNGFGWVNDIRGNYPAAIEYYERSLNIRREINDESGVANSINNIGLIHMNLSNYAKAEQMFRESIQLGEKINSAGLANSWMNLGSVHLNTGNYAMALTAYQRSLELERKRGNAGNSQLINIGMVFESQADLDRAMEYYGRGLAAAEKADSKQNMANALVSMGRVEQLGGNSSMALELQTRALSIYRQIDYRVEIANTLNNLAGVYVDMGKFTEAHDHLNEAIEISRELGDPDTIFQVLLQKASVLIAERKFDAARETALLSRASFEKTGGSDVEWRMHEILAKANKGSGRISEAKQDLRNAIAAIERQRLMVAGGAHERHDTFAQMTSPYFQLAQILASENDALAALRLTEQAKAKSLLDALSPGSIRISGHMSVEEKAQEMDLQQEVRAANAKLSMSDPGNANSRKQLEDQLAAKRSNLRDFQLKLFLKYPDLEAQRGILEPISSSELSAMFKEPGTALVSFLIDQDDALMLVAVKGTSGIEVKAFQLKSTRKELAAAVDAYRFKLASGDLGFQKASRDLYDLLLKPSEKELAGKTNIIIAPDGPIWDLPFQALMDGTGKYLIEKAAVSYTPSLTALREMSKKARGRKAHPDAELLAFGNPIVGSGTRERVKRVFISEKLEPLPEAERLVNELGRLYGPARSKILTGNAAREETAKSESPKYRIVQFATHGILNNASPMYSHLVLSQNEKNPNEDGLLEAWEMKDLDLKADMVILSACETARGRISNGEGVIGMSWAMFIAGTPTTVASQWKVESSSTTELMLEFHRQLLAGKGVSKAEALRRASLKLMKLPKYKHPSYWAGFVIVGDGS